MKLLYHLGRYCLLMSRVFTKPDKPKIFLQQTIKEIKVLGIDSIGIIILISVFIGAVITIQTALNLENPLIPRYYIGLVARDTLLLEFSSTMVGLILAGKIGSNIASEIGTMRVSEQIDALEIMGVNSANYLILPKVVATLFFNPVLNVISIAVGLAGGWIAAVTTDIVLPSDYLYGIHYWFIPFYVTYSFIKTLFFAFIITSISAYYGYFVKGGALQVGQASTRAVVYSSVFILLFNLILTQLLLT
jgi:phospholipid/cholesterol/gamma-HCH transport system permease protein